MLELVRVCKRRSGCGASAPIDAEDMILDDVSVRVDAGDVVMVNGTVGAGKTTLLSMLYGAVTADSGRVGVLGYDVGRLRRGSLARLRRRIGIIPQQIRLVEHRTALDNVRLPLEVMALPRRECRVRAADALGSVGLATRVDVPVTKLSMGERQRVAIARAIVADPELIIADEPTAHLDTETGRKLIELLAILQTAGATAIVATGDRDILDEGALCGWRRVDLVRGRLVDPAGDVDVAGVIEVDDRYDEIDIDIDIVDSVAEPDTSAPNVVPFPLAAR